MKKRLTCLGLMLLTACKTTQPAQTRSISLKPSALIGTAYDANTEEFTGMSCLDVADLTADDYEVTAAKAFTTDVLQKAEEAELEKIFGSFQKFFYAPATGLRLSRPYETVQRILEGDLEAVWLIRTQSQSGSLRFRSDSHPRLRLTPDAQKLVQHILQASGADREKHLEVFVQTCGTGFLSGMRYALGMAATLRWTFKNPAEKSSWKRQTATLSLDRILDGEGPLGVMRLRYDSFFKETRDISALRLGDVGRKDCASEFHQPCLDALRIFMNRSLPTYHKLVLKLAEQPDLILPQAFLTEPEIMRYQDIEPALAGLELEPQSASAETWKGLRSRFLHAYVQSFRRLQEVERALPLQDTRVQEIQKRLQTISSLAAPCYRPFLKRDACAQNADLL